MNRNFMYLKAEAQRFDWHKTLFVTLALVFVGQLEAQNKLTAFKGAQIYTI
ncbi:MAG: hypothetical protein RL582_1724, partial [Bacteroidota bacterium]